MSKNLTAEEFAEYLKTLGINVPVQIGEHIAWFAGEYSYEGETNE